MAARSLRFTARARWPIARGGTNRVSKCTPSTSASVVTTSRALRTGVRTAASSPGPTTTHDGTARRLVMRAMSACSPRSPTVWMCHGRSRTDVKPVCQILRAARSTRCADNAPLCRVGRLLEPAQAGGAAVIDRVTGFLGTEACTTRGPAAHLGSNIGSRRAPEYHHGQSRSTGILAHPAAQRESVTGVKAVTQTLRRVRVRRRENLAACPARRPPAARGAARVRSARRWSTTVCWRARKHSSAMFRATSSASPSMSLDGVASAAVRIFMST